MTILRSSSFWFSLICLISLLIGWLGPVYGIMSESVAVYFFVLSYITGGYYGVKESFEALLEKRASIDLLMILAAIGAALINQWMEGAILLFLFSLSNALQDFALDKSNSAIESLMKLRPDTARVLRDDGLEEDVPIEDISVGTTILVKPGERFPLDSVVLEGSTAADQSAITGESMPVEKNIGDDIFGGTMNTLGAVSLVVTRHSSESTIAKIIELVQRARAGKAKTQRILDTFEPLYAGGVLLATALLVLIPWMLDPSSFDRIFYRAMTILVVASPCALVISTPATILSAIANAARRGVLFKGGVYLEQAASLQYIAMDKTGTLTKGMPEVTDLIPAEGITEFRLLQLTASAENMSEHPIADSVVRAANKRKIERIPITNLQAVTGKGIIVEIGDEIVRVGSRRLMNEAGIVWPEDLMIKAEQLESDGKTVIFASLDTTVLGLIALADQIKPEAKEALAELHELGIREIIMLTGDSELVARAVAKDLGIDDVRAELLPGSKESIIRDLAQKGPVAMVGDGVNDAPALASGNLGVAMGSAGSDVALETADVVLMSDDLLRLPWLIRLSRRAKRVVWQNIIFSLSVIVVLVLSVFFFELPLPLGVVGHEGSTLIVVANGLRLLGGSND